MICRQRQLWERHSKHHLGGLKGLPFSVANSKCENVSLCSHDFFLRNFITKSNIQVDLMKLFLSANWQSWEHWYSKFFGTMQTVKYNEQITNYKIILNNCMAIWNQRHHLQKKWEVHLMPSKNVFCLMRRTKNVGF